MAVVVQERNNVVYRRRFINGSLAAGATETFQEDRSYEKRKFFNKNFLAVFNNSGELIEIHINGETSDANEDAITFEVAPSASPVVLIEPKDGVFYQWVTIENLDSTNTSAAGEIVVEMRVVE